MFLNYKIRTYLMARYKACGLVSVSIKQEESNYVVALNTEDVETFLETANQSAEQIADELRERF